MTFTSDFDRQIPSVDPVEELRRSGFVSLATGAIRLYQRTISRATPPICRYKPSCSQYGIEAIEKFGVIDGSRLAIRRIGSCHRPNGGYDPVPDVLPWKTTMQSSVESVEKELCTRQKN